MGVISYPRIAGTQAEQLAGIRSYLYQLAEELNRREKEIPQGEQSQKALASQGETQASFASLKALIIKSADIVDAYCQQISKRLEGAYVARSDFGIYARQTAAELVATDTKLEQNYRAVQSLVTDLQTRQLETNAYIRTGKLYESDGNDGLEPGTPVYGVEVGQSQDGDFQRFGRFTARGLTFYDEKGAPVAMIADGRLRVFHAQVESSFTEGGFTTEVLAQGELVTRWTGL